MPSAARRRPFDARLLRQGPQVLFLLLPVLVGIGVVILARSERDAIATRPAVSASSESRLVAQAQVQWRGLDAVLAPCDAAARGGGPDPARSLTASRLCDKAGLELMALKPPAAAPSRLQARFQTALETCQFDYLARGNAYGRLARAQGREARAAARIEVDRADLEAHGCRIGYIAAARAAGVPFDALPAPKAGF